MAVFKCKMCGGSLEIAGGESVAVCEYCGSKQTLPRMDSERKTNLYDRANHFRRNNEFDKAEGIYEQILNEDPTDAEAYWSLVLCRYGIEYVEDPATRHRVPTVNRAQYTSVYADENYKKALENADGLQRSVYEDEAKAIDEIQKGILAISEKEEPFDVFICYKETDAQGRRTPDSVLANELYHELSKEGFKVFFSRITLEDKLGTAYEPYIFAALNSARVMVVLGTKPEYFNAVWVKNEWSRYLALIRAGGKKSLIPAYRDMDPYELPEEFSHLQAQDMSKLGFMPDLIRGVKKLLGADEPKVAPAAQQAVQSTGNASLTAQLKRGQQALEDRDWSAAEGFFDKALDMDAECAEAFFGKALAVHRASSGESLVLQRLGQEANPSKAERLIACERDEAIVNNAVEKYRLPDFLDPTEIREYFKYDERTYVSMTKAWKERIAEETVFWEGDRNLSRALRYAKGDFAETLGRLRKEIETGLEKKLAESEAEAAQAKADTAINYADAMVRAERTVEEKRKAAEQKKEKEYLELCKMQERADSTLDYSVLVNRFTDRKWQGYKDCAERAEKCRTEAERIKLAAEKAAAAAKKKKKTIGVIAAAAAVVIITAALVVTKVIIPGNKYKAAEALLAAGDYDEAVAAFAAMGDYKNSAEMVDEAKYQKAEKLLNSADFDAAYSLLFEVGREDKVISSKHERATALLDSGDYESAYALLRGIGENDTIIANKHERAIELLDSGDYESAYALLKETGEKDIINASKYERAVGYLDAGEYELAEGLLLEVGVYEDSKALLNQTRYAWAEALYAGGDPDAAYQLADSLGMYQDSQERKIDYALSFAQMLEESGSIRQAVEWYEKADDIESADRMRMQYINENYNGNSISYEYILTLINHGDGRAQAMYEDLFSVNYKVLINSERTDLKNNNTTIYAEAEYQHTYFHLSYSGGIPTEFTIPVRIEVMYKRSNGEWDTWESYKYDELSRNCWVTDEFTDLGKTYFRLVVTRKDTDEIVVDIPIVIYNSYA